MITKNEISSLNLSPTKKDFVQIWNELIEVASKITERWDPTSTNESDPGIVLLKVLAGIADKLNYNIDKNILEAYMPTAAQMESMRKLCELMGYDIKYYQSAETKVRISYTGNTNDEEEKLPINGLQLPKFTTITNADKDITFVTTNAVPVYITNSIPWAEVSCIEGQISQCESINENNLITLAQLDDNYRYYLPEIQIAENGIFVYSAAVFNGAYIDGTPWEQVSNLNARATETRVFKFGYDSFEGRPYLAFPEDVGSLMGDGLFIYFVRTSGLNGNISPGKLEALELPTGGGWDEYSAEQFEVVNVDAATNGANIESISTAYNNFKKTVGTFDTLVTCRDYMNKIYSLMDASNLPYVSNILVTDIRNDINSAVTLCSCNEFGILYKEMPLTNTVKVTSTTTATDVSVAEIKDSSGKIINQLIINKNSPVEVETEIPLIDHFDLVLYPFKTFTQVSSGAKDFEAPYTKSFTYTEQMNDEIEASLADLKTCAHNLTTPAEGDIVAINNYLRLNALIATSNKVSENEATDILKNVKAALVNEFNLRNLDFGEEIPFENILSVIENADSRIKVVSLQEPTVLTTYSVKEPGENGLFTSKEYGVASTDGPKIYGVNYLDKTIKGETAKDIYNKLVLRNILAGRASLFDYDETFIPNNSEKPYTVTNDITSALKLDQNAPVFDDAQAQAKLLAEAVKAIMLANTDEESGNIKPGEYLVYNADNTALITGLDGGVVTLNVYNADITELVSAILVDNTHKDYLKAVQIQEAVDAIAIPDRHILPIKGFFNGVLTLVVTESADKIIYENICEVYETYEPSFAYKEIPAAISSTPEPTSELYTNQGTPSSRIIDDITRIEALCEISSTNEDGLFDNITLAKNEVIKFRAPNLVTTKTFPAYVYYRFEKGSRSNKAGADEGHYATAEPLTSFITDVGPEEFFTKLWSLADTNTDENLKTSSFTYTFDPEALNISQSDRLTTIFNSAIVIGTQDGQYFFAARGKLDEYLTGLGTTPGATVSFKYYPLNNGTIPTWSSCIRTFASLPGDTTLWRLSSTSNYPLGQLVLSDGRRLFAQSGDYLVNSRVGDVTYICTDLGKDPKYYTVSENSDIELQDGDKLYIHYTPSSTNEDGETENAEPISIVYEGSAENPIILKPSGFTLMPSEDVNKQGTSWKKTGVDFNGVKKDLLALAPNEQIEMRSVSKVVLDKPARFYKNFDNIDLERININEVTQYELKDGEYIFYTDLNTQEAAYYGSGSVITLEGGANIPKASDPVEVSQILEQGLRIVPWSNTVLLGGNRKVTITEYQYVTLTEGDTLNTLTIDAQSAVRTIGNSGWIKCDQENPITYTPAGASTAITLPKIALGQDSRTTWEVCSFLELSTSPGYSQTLRATRAGVNSNALITNKVNVYASTGTGEKLAAVITPQQTSPLVAGGTNTFEDVSIKLSTIAQSASGSFKKPSNADEDIAVQMKVFKEEAPAKIELTNLDEAITPISTNYAVPVTAKVTDINNYWSKVDIGAELWRSYTVPDTLNPGTYIERKQPNAFKLNFMIPEDNLFGVFSIYLEVPVDKLDKGSKQNMLKGPSENEVGETVPGARIFIDIPAEFGSYKDVISIFNNGNDWWSEGIDPDKPNRLYLRAGLNCIKITKSCSLLLKSEEKAAGSILYDNMKLVRGVATNGVNLKLLDPDATFNLETEKAEKTLEEKVKLANKVLAGINTLDKNHDFYYNVPIENSLAIEFDDNINSFSNPYTLYDINNINNSFVVSKLDVKYLDDGLRIAKSSRY